MERDKPEYKYVLAAAQRMTAELARLDVSYVQAASNYVTGLPALIAARKLKVPFFYEVRGLWEITRMSRDDAFAKSISFDVQRYLEGSLAREADHVFTLTEPMREELIERGVDPERITLLPNSVDADRFLPAVRDEGLARELGIPRVVVIGPAEVASRLGITRNAVYLACARIKKRVRDEFGDLLGDAKPL